MKSPVVKRSIVIAGHKTSVSLEDALLERPQGDCRRPGSDPVRSGGDDRHRSAARQPVVGHSAVRARSLPQPGRQRERPQRFARDRRQPRCCQRLARRLTQARRRCSGENLAGQAASATTRGADPLALHVTRGRIPRSTNPDQSQLNAARLRVPDIGCAPCAGDGGESCAIRRSNSRCAAPGTAAD